MTTIDDLFRLLAGAFLQTDVLNDQHDDGENIGQHLQNMGADRGARRLKT